MLSASFQLGSGVHQHKYGRFACQVEGGGHRKAKVESCLACKTETELMILMLEVVKKFHQNFHIRLLVLFLDALKAAQYVSEDGRVSLLV